MPTIHLTTHWGVADMKKHAKDLILSFAKYIEKFPNDHEMGEVIGAILEGTRALWVILDDDERFMASVTTSIETLKNGQCILRICELAGEGGLPLVACIDAIEAWGRQYGATKCVISGRAGWLKALKAKHYTIQTVNYIKDLTHGL